MKSKGKTYFLVGDEKSERTNQWYILTNSFDEATKFVEENPLFTTVKTVEVVDRRGKKR